MAEDENCIFCKIVAGDIPAKVVYESDSVIAFLDINPATEGHTLVVSKQHYPTLLDMPDDELGPFFIELKKVAALIKEKLESDGFNIIQNNFPAAGQGVPHFHYHIIPRKENDKVLKLPQPKTPVAGEKLDEVLEKLK
jgi:histidine triad (HIT) family protein